MAYFLKFLCIPKASLLTLLGDICKFVNQTLHYSNKFNNIIVCHWKCHFTITLFLFQDPHNAFQMCHTTFNYDLIIFAVSFVCYIHALV